MPELAVDLNAVRRRKKRAAFTEEEDLIIIQCHMKFGRRWARMRNVIRTRSDKDVKNRWNSTMRRVYRNIYNPKSIGKRGECEGPLYAYCLKVRANLGICKAERKFLRVLRNRVHVPQMGSYFDLVRTHLNGSDSEEDSKLGDSKPPKLGGKRKAYSAAVPDGIYPQACKLLHPRLSQRRKLMEAQRPASTTATQPMMQAMFSPFVPFMGHPQMMMAGPQGMVYQNPYVAFTPQQIAMMQQQQQLLLQQQQQKSGMQTSTSPNTIVSRNGEDQASNGKHDKSTVDKKASKPAADASVAAKMASSSSASSSAAQHVQPMGNLSPNPWALVNPQQMQFVPGMFPQHTPQQQQMQYTQMPQQSGPQPGGLFLPPQFLATARSQQSQLSSLPQQQMRPYDQMGQPLMFGHYSPLPVPNSPLPASMLQQKKLSKSPQPAPAKH